MVAATLDERAERSGSSTHRERGRIAVLLHDLRGGGAERVMLALVRGFVDAGRDVDLLLVKKCGDYLHEIPVAANVVDLGKSHVIGAVPAIARYLRRAKPASILTAMTHVNQAAVLARALSGTRPRLVLTEHNQITIKADQAKGLRSRLVYGGARYLYPHADAIVAVSSGVADDLAKYLRVPRADVRVLYNPVTHAGLTTAAAAPVGHPWFAPDQPPVILGVGRLHRQKGFDILLQAFSLLRKSTQCRLVIAGEGDERPALEAMVRELGIGDDVALLGFVSNPFALMARAGVFVLSSRWEGLPTVLAEAMYCGAPVVAADCPSGASEILEGGRYGSLVPVENPTELARAIAETLRTKPPASRERAEQFGVDVAVRNYLDLLECPL